ncbi:MAG: hypothetical protein ACOYMA_09415 [Bacteroidia bacterium]
MKKREIIIGFLFLLIVVSCGDKTKKFKGYWQNLKNKQGNEAPDYYQLWIITESGGNLILEYDKRKFPAIYNKEQDKLEVKDGIIALDIIYDDNTKHLFSNGNEYEKTCSYKRGNTSESWSPCN